MSLGLLATPTVTIAKVAKMVFNVAPGNFYLSQYLEYQEANGTSATASALANLLGGTDAAFITTVLTNLGLQDDAVAQSFMESNVAASGRGAALEAAIDALASISEDDPTYGEAVTAFNAATVASVVYSTNTANNSTDVAVLSAVVDPDQIGQAATAGQTFTLTTGLDSGASFTGGSGADTFVGTDTTFTTGDSLNGGEGTDTLTLLFGDASVVPVVDTVAIEMISLRNSEAAQVLTLDASGWEGVTTLETLRSNDDVVLTGVQANATLSMNRMADAKDFDVTFADDAVDSATATLSVAADDSDANLLVETGGDDVFTTLNVAVATDSVIDLTLADGAGNDDTLTTINVTGAGALELTEAAAEFEQVTTITVADGGLTIDTDGNAEDVTVTAGNGDNDLIIDGGGDVNITAGNGDNTIVVGAGDDEITTGSGDDTITIGAGIDTVNSGAGNDVIIIGANLTADDDIDFGDGTADVLVAESADLNTIATGSAALRAAVSNYEIIRVSNDLTHSLDVSKFGVNYVQLTEVDLGADLTLSGFTTGATIEFRGAEDMQDGSIIIGMTGAQAGGTPNDTLNIKLNADLPAAATTYDVDLDVAGINILNFVAGDRGAATVTTGGYDIDLNETAVGNDANVREININSSVDFNYVSSATANAIAEIDGSTSTGDLNIDIDLFAGTEGVIVTTGAGDDTIVGSDLADNLNGGAGDDVLTGGAGDDSLTGGEGSDTFTFAATAAGNGEDTITDFTVGDEDGDLLDVTDFLTTFQEADHIVELDSDDADGDLTVGDDIVYLLNYEGDIADLDFGVGDDFDLLFGTDVYFSTDDPSFDAIIVVQGDDVTHVYYVADPAGAAIDATDVTLVGTLTGVTNADTFVTGNFV
jgi:Ca2+-binding RTX toxin-like protein